MNIRRVVAAFALIAFLVMTSASTIVAQPPGKPVDTPTPAAGPPTGAETPGSLRPSAETPAAPEADSSASLAPRLDLAAMALDSTVVPEGFQLFYEIYVPGNVIADDLTGGIIPQAEVDATGLQWYYESVYVSADGTTRLRSYIEQYLDVDGAIRGFDLLEDEQRLAPAGSVFTDSPGAGVGEAPSEISEGSLQPSGSPMVVTSIDSTFRTGNLLAGVSVDTIPGVTADRQLAVDLTQVLFDRIQAVLGDQPLALIDDQLPGQMVSLGPDWRHRDEGYLSAAEAFGPQAAAPIAPAFVSAYFTNQSLHAVDDAPLPVPLVSMTVSRFQDDATPLQLLSQSTLLEPPFPGVEPLDIEPIPGSAVTLAFQYANPMLSAATLDSVRIVMVVGSALMILDIQGNATIDGARDAAIEIATAQAGCLVSVSACPPLALTPGLLAPPAGPGTPGPVG